MTSFIENSENRVNSLENLITRLKGACYLDHLGSALYIDSQIEAITKDLINNLYGNPHSSNLVSKYCADAVDQIRFRILEHFNTNADEYDVIFTSGATQSLKLVVEWFDWGNTDALDDESASHFVYTRDNHTSVLGLREIVSENEKINVHCMQHDEAFVEFSKIPRIGDVLVQKSRSNSLFVYSAQCNFSGCKYPLQWIDKIHRGILNDWVGKTTRINKRHSTWFCLLDAASYVPTNDLDLARYKPDFVAASFYKMFGYPTGLGVLLVKKTSDRVLHKKYYGGGTILMALSDQNFHRKRSTLHERCEDGTVNFLSIISLRHGFDSLKFYGGSMDKISKKVFNLARKLHDKLSRLHHSNGKPMAIIYRDTDYTDVKIQGGVVNFNLRRSNGEYIGYFEVLHVANSRNIHLRTGCFCNPGACQRHLNLTNEQLIKNFEKGHTCADNIDLIDGYPTGSLRVSFGYLSRDEDIDKLMNMIVDCFAEKPVRFEMPDDWPKMADKLRSKFLNEENRRSVITEEGKKTLKCFDRKNFASVDDSRGNSDVEELKLLKIYIYPIKSCGAFEITSKWPLSQTGLKYDREWMIVSSDKVVLTQKQIPLMCLITPRVDTNAQVLRLEYEGNKICIKPIEIPLDVNVTQNSTLQINQSKVCNHQVTITDYGDEAAHWLQTCLNVSGIRLVKLINRRKSKTEVSLSLANQAQYLLITEASIKWLFGKTSITSTWEEMMKRFRANLIVRSQNHMKPLEELKWSKITIGNFKFEVTGPCSRCHMICIDQSTGEKNTEPLTVLASALEGKINFGVYLRLENTNSDVTHLNIDEPLLPIY